MLSLNDLQINTIDTNCDFCGGNKFIPLFDKMRHGLNLSTVICENCALSFTNPQPTEETLGNFYEKFYHLFHGRKAGVNDYYIYKSQRFATLRANLLKTFVNSDSTDKKLLEVGCGAGQFILELNNSTAWDVMGIEPGKESYEFCKSQNLNVKNMGMEEFTSDVKFDIIASFHVLDHLRSPKGFLEKCYDLLNEGGLLCIEASNFYKPGNDYGWFMQFPRLFNFSHVTLSNYFKANGFEVIYIKEGTNSLIMIGTKVTKSHQPFIKTDIPDLIKNVRWVDKVQRISKKIPGRPYFFRKLKEILTRTSV